jgi:hypothetical protein
MKRPISIVVVSWVFIAVGVIGLISGLLPLASGSNATTSHGLLEILLVSSVRLVALLSGVLMLRGSNLGRWLLVAWLLFHVVLSIWHSRFELIVHILLMIVVVYVLFRPSASAYFRSSK